MKKIISFLSVVLFSAILFQIAQPISAKTGIPAAPIAVTSFVLCMILKPKGGVVANAFTEGLCENVQRTLIDIFKTRAPELQRTQLGYVQALMSPINMGGVEIIPIDQGNGKTRSVRLTYIQRGIDDDIIYTKWTDCSTDNEPGPFEQIVSISNWIGKTGIKFSETEMRKLCEGDQMYMARVLNANLDALTKDLDRKLLVDLTSNWGAFVPALSDPGLWRDVQMLNGSSNMAPIYYSESQIIQDFTNIGYTGKPIVVGTGLLAHYMRQTSIGCCNDSGINLAQAGNLYFFHDLEVNTYIGTNHFIGLVPGMVQLITKNDYVGTYAKESPTFSHGTVTDPFTGITWDIKWHYNDCDDTYSMQIGVWYKQFFMPSDIYQADDDFYGVNGVLHYRATSAAVTYA